MTSVGVFSWFMRLSFRCFWLMVLVSVKMRNQISISAIIQFMNSILRSKLTSAKFELVFPDIEDIVLRAVKKRLARWLSFGPGGRMQIILCSTARPAGACSPLTSAH